MKNVIFILTILSSGAVFAQSQGKNITADFLKTYAGKFVEGDFKESVTIGMDGSIVVQRVRQVGAEGDKEVPYPTVCSYVEKGRIRNVIERSANDRDQYMDFATHIINYSISKVELNNDLDASTTANPNCQNFAKKENAAIKQGGTQSSAYSELLGKDSLRLHTSGGGDYVKGRPRTPSTLDEVYVRSN